MAKASDNKSNYKDEFVLVSRDSAEQAGLVGSIKLPNPALPSVVPVLKPTTDQKLQAPSSQFTAMMRGKAKQLDITVPFSFSMSCGGGGVVNPSTAIAPDSNATEWNALIALYDEYRVNGGVIKYMLGYGTPTVPKDGSGLSSDYAHVLVYDPVDITALTGVRNGAESLYHKLTMPKFRTSGTAAAPAVVGTFDGIHSLPFSSKGVKALPVTAGGALGNIPPGQWLECNAAGNNQACGFIKSYGTSFHASVQPCVSGIVYLHMSFRARK